MNLTRKPLVKQVLCGVGPQRFSLLMAPRRGVWATRAIGCRTAPDTLVATRAVSVQTVRAVRTTVSVACRTAMSAFCRHVSFPFAKYYSTIHTATVCKL